MKRVFLILSLAAFTFSCHKNNSASSSNDTNGPAEDVISTNTNTETKEKKETTSKTVANAEESTAEAKKDEEIKWMTYDEAVKASKKTPKKIFLDVHTDWCGWCKKMEKTTLKDPKIAEYMNQKYYAVKLNAEGTKELTYQGKKVTEKQLAGTIFKITGYPTTVYLEPNEKLIQPIPGFMDTANLDKILHYIGEDHYKTQTWEQFQMSYK